MTNVLMTLGDFQFEVARNAFSELQRQRSYRWTETETLSMTPLQYTGRAAESITLEGVLYPLFVGEGGMDYMRRLRELADRAEPSLLISDGGENFGRFVILNISETYEHLTIGAIPKKITFRIDLKEYQEMPKAKPEKKAVPERRGSG